MRLFDKYSLFLLVSYLTFWEATTLVPGHNPDGFSTLEDDDVTVAVNNRLPPGANFTVHCASNDEDLGVHIVYPFGYYEFSFDVNFFRTTTFFCSVRWLAQQAAFAAYSASRDMSRCPQYCVWNVQADGIKGFKQGPGTDADIVIPWK